MLHILQSAPAPLSDAAMRSMFAARKSVFVDLLKWDVPVLADAYENMLETCADAFGRKQLGHAHRPPGRMSAGLDSQARFSRLGATLVALGQSNVTEKIRNLLASGHNLQPARAALGRRFSGERAGQEN